MKDSKPLISTCERRLIADSYLSRFAKYCSEYCKDVKVENLIKGNTYPDIEKSMHNLSALLLEYLNLKLRNIRLESDRQTFLLNTALINQKFKDLIWITQKNTESFLLKLNTRYKETLMSQSDDDPEKF